MSSTVRDEITKLSPSKPPKYRWQHFSDSGLVYRLSQVFGGWGKPATLRGLRRTSFRWINGGCSAESQASAHACVKDRTPRGLQERAYHTNKLGDKLEAQAAAKTKLSRSTCQFCIDYTQTPPESRVECGGLHQFITKNRCGTEIRQNSKLCKHEINTMKHPRGSKTARNQAPVIAVKKSLSTKKSGAHLKYNLS